MHPYVAIHVAQVHGCLQPGKLSTCLKAGLAKAGLSRLKIDVEQQTFEYEAHAADYPLRVVDGGERPMVSLPREMEKELNLPFPFHEPFTPLRFFAVPAGDSFFLGLTYFHPIADAESVVLLFKSLLTFCATGDANGLTPLDLYPDPGLLSLRRHPGVLARKALAIPAQVRQMRRSHRPHYADHQDMTNGFSCLTLNAELSASVLAAAKSWKVTVNDLFICLLLKALSPGATSRVRSRRRRLISVGCVTNARADLKLDRARTFGLFLGAFTVSHEVPDVITTRDLAADVRKQTARFKDQKLHLGASIDLVPARLALRFFPREAQKKFFAKTYPVCGGVTNMNLNPLWAPTETGAPMDYLRGVSTGPVTPLALSVTTFRDRIHLGVSYRTTVFARDQVEMIQSRIEQGIEDVRRAL